ncbi:chorismate mutase [uncultured Sunxiuqinia sp.]|uniref:chorismate mutase n=1 Tax=uncultured Sunxiuqinia sp. TaxID=1573825 RepID=UPI002AA7E06F|nr:chorismate mutase [uncultured Sunxiuqinia sp.]
MKKPSACNTIEGIRNEIDHIDLSILKLLANRQEFIEEIVKYKTDQDSVIAEDRQKEVYAQRREWANDLQLNAAFIENIFKQLVQHNIERELKLLKNKP